NEIAFDHFYLDGIRRSPYEPTAASGGSKSCTLGGGNGIEVTGRSRSSSCTRCRICQFAADRRLLKNTKTTASLGRMSSDASYPFVRPYQPRHSPASPRYDQARSWLPNAPACTAWIKCNKSSAVAKTEPAPVRNRRSL